MRGSARRQHPPRRMMMADEGRSAATFVDASNSGDGLMMMMFS